MRKADGSIALQWQKTHVDAEAQHQALLDAFASVATTIPRAKRVKSTRARRSNERMVVVPIGDPHIGMHAWAQQTGDRDFDLKIATTELIDAVDRLVERAPACERLLIAEMGDMFHADNSENRTSRSGHALDVDGRYGKIAAAGVAIGVAWIDRGLEKFGTVEVDVKIGNHDDHSSQWLALCLQQRYHDNPRVKIVGGTGRIHTYHTFGRNLIGLAHGHTGKSRGTGTLAEIMAHDEPKAWAHACNRWWLVGHLHSLSREERPGVMIEHMRTLAARDYYTSGNYRSGQDIQAVLLDADYGEIERYRVSQMELRDRYARRKGRKQ